MLLKTQVAPCAGCVVVVLWCSVYLVSLLELEDGLGLGLGLACWVVGLMGWDRKSVSQSSI